MSRIALLTAIAGLAISLPASAETKTYSLESFQKISASAGVKVTYEAGATQTIIAENKNNNFEKLILETRGDTLVVSRKSSGWFGNRNRQNYTVRITAPDISGIEASSGASVSATGMKGDKVKLSSSSGSNLNAKNIEAETVSIQASSGSDLDAYGSCSSVTLSSSSGSSIDADGLICSNVTASASSGSSLSAHATTQVDGSASSGASVKVVGGASEVEKQKSSGGSVTVT
jgi:hypothetical protein